MGNIFPKWTNWLAIKVLVAVGCCGVYVVALAWYSWTPKYSRAGYMPQQPIPFDHSLHVQQLGMDCRYCHSHVENSLHSNIPAAEVCWNCHGPGKVKYDSVKLEPLRAAMDPSYENYTGEPIEWVRVHKVPDYAYFNHAAHVNRGVSCVACHGRVDEMPVVYHAESLSMGFCLDCHRQPEKHLRPLDQVTNLAWQAEDLDRDQFYDKLAASLGEDAGELASEDADKEWSQELIGTHLKHAWGVNPPQDCSACHR